MDESKLEEIWRRNLRQYNGNIRLDSIIMMSMMQAVEEQRKIDQAEFQNYIDSCENPTK